METLGPLTALVVGVFLIFLSTLALLMPFFVFQIRAEMKKVNKNFEKIISIIGDGTAKGSVKTNAVANEKNWPHCGAVHKRGESICALCRKPLT